MARAIVRLRAVQIGLLAAVVTLVARAAQVQLVDGADHAAVARAQRTERVELPARRGAIYDRNGVPLALTRETYHVGVAPNELRDPDRDGAALARSLGLDRRRVSRALQKGYAYFHGPFTPTRVAAVRDVQGVHLGGELTRFHPDPEFARAVLGLPAAPGRPASGVERVLDTLLSGRPGSAVVLRDQFGRQVESPSRLGAFPERGRDVYLTLDVELQDIVERALADAIARLDAKGGDVVALNPRTGELLAVASRQADGQVPPSVFTSVFEPGSTAKLFAAAALLKYRAVAPTDSVWGEEGRYLLGRRAIHDEHPRGWMTLEDAIRHSSNIAIVKLAARLTPEQQFTVLRDFGFGTPTGVEYPSESAGLLYHPHEWSGASPASLAMGYEVAVTVLQLAQAYAAIANDGVMLRPTLLHSVRTADGKEIYRHTPEPVRRVVSPEVARELRAMLRDVVYDGGTGRTAALATYEVAGKTGTARRAGPGGYEPGAYTASFASLFPADDPQIVMVVKLDDPAGAYARLTAAPLTRSMLSQILAARTSALDPGELGGSPAAPGLAPAVDTGTVPYVVDWPLRSSTPATGERSVPDVVGLSVRRAAQKLHEVGLNVRVNGWGTVTRMQPSPGTALTLGAQVLLTARAPRDRP